MIRAGELIIDLQKLIEKYGDQWVTHDVILPLNYYGGSIVFVFTTSRETTYI